MDELNNKIDHEKKMNKIKLESEDGKIEYEKNKIIIEEAHQNLMKEKELDKAKVINDIKLDKKKN